MDEKLKLKFLGTGCSHGIPMIGDKSLVSLSTNIKDKRLRSSIIISKNNESILIDCGPDLRQQLLTNKIHKLENIIITHEHNDHIIGLDEIRSITLYSSIKLFSIERVVKELKNKFNYLLKKRNKYNTPILDIIIINFYEKIFISNFKIEPIIIIHGKLPIAGYIIDDKIAYITDVKIIPKQSLKKIKNIKILIISCLKKYGDHKSHINLEEAINYSKIICAKKTYLTHISIELGLHELVEKELPNNINLAYDGLEIII